MGANTMIDPTFKFSHEDSGNYRTYYKSIKTKRLYCIQNDVSFGKDNFVFCPCSKDGEPEYSTDIPDKSRFDKLIFPSSIEK
jgi:hypothetical protein